MFNIQEGQTSHSKKFNCDQHVFKIQFNEINLTFGEGQSEITRMFTEVHQKLLSLLKNDNDKIRITFLHSSFDHPIGN